MPSGPVDGQMERASAVIDPAPSLRVGGALGTLAPARWRPRAPAVTRRQVLRLMALAVGLGVAYALGALLTFVFLDAPEAGVAFFPAAGLTFSALVLTRRRLWPLWLLAIVVAEVSVDVTHGQSWWMAIGFAAANCAEPVCGASIVQHLSRPARRDLRRELVVFLCGGVVAGPIVGALIGATVAIHTAGTDAWLGVFWRWWLGDAVGVLVVALPILIWVARSPFEPPLAVRRIAATTVIAVVVTLVPALLWQHPMLYCVLPVLMAPAIVGDRMAAAVAGLGVAFAADWAAVTGRADDLLASTAPGRSSSTCSCSWRSRSSRRRRWRWRSSNVSGPSASSGRPARSGTSPRRRRVTRPSRCAGTSPTRCTTSSATP